MTLYTVMPEETVWEGYDSYEPDYMEVQINGITMQVERLNATQAKIVRIYSGNALDYANPAYTPGNLVEFQPFFR